MRGAFLTLAVFSSLTVSLAKGDTTPLDPEKGRIQVRSSVAETYYQSHSITQGVELRCEWGVWGGSLKDDYVGFLHFCEAPEAGGYEVDRYESLTNFRHILEEYFGLVHVWRRKSPGPRIETVVGELRAIGFDFTEFTNRESDRQCLGGSIGWDKRWLGTRRLNSKRLLGFACGQHGLLMTEDAFRSILADIAVTNEFDTLISR